MNNSHKYVILWTSKFYRNVNKCMRDKNVDEQVSDFPHAVYFIKNYIEYFFKYGVHKNQIQSNKLFRGYKLSGSVDSSHNGFISTSRSISIAQHFAGKSGIVITFKTRHLPKDVPFVIITKDIVPHSSEDEVVFLPGFITTGKKYSEFKLNDALINMYKNVQLQINGSAQTPDAFQDIKIDLRNKLVVWYRKIYNRHPDIIGITRLPNTVKKVQESWQEIVLDNDDRFELATDLIPEYQDLKKSKINASLQDRIIASRKMDSFNIYTAIVDGKTNRVLTLHYGIPRQMFAELFDISQADLVESEIMKHVASSLFYGK